jgi:O-methyltransferase
MVRRAVGEWRRERRHREIFRRFRDFTMVSPSTYCHNLQLAERVRGVVGCVVECGVWRGGMIAGIATLLGPDRDYFLLDSFEGLPPPREIDGPRAIAWQQQTDSSTYFDNCSAPPEMAERAMIRSGAGSFHLVKGWFSETLPALRLPSPIALLRLDADWYESTRTCLDHLFDFLAPGGLLLLDDYYTWDGCSRALHDFLSRRSALERIRNLGEVCYLQKALPQATGAGERPTAVCSGPESQRTEPSR